MAFMLVAIAVCGVGTASGGGISCGALVRTPVVLAGRPAIGHGGLMPVMQAVIHGRRPVQRLSVPLGLLMAHMVSLIRVLLHGHGVACQTAQGQQKNHEQREKAAHGVNDSEGRGLVPARRSKPQNR